MVVVSNMCSMESYPIVILSESVLRENLRRSMKAPGMPIQF
jgi:hypothetical protein